MASSPSLPRLYAILDVDLARARGLHPQHILTVWLDAGVRLVQLRAKGWTLGPFVSLAEELGAFCHEAGATFLVNDRADVASLARADGVHLGQDDLATDEARRLLASDAWVGLSTHSDAQISEGLLTSATYLAIGPVFGTRTKARPDPVVGLEGVRRAAALVASRKRPLVAIGGIREATAAAVLAAGADAVAVVADLIDGEDPATRARALIKAVA